MVLSLGHESIIDHDYLVFALEDVSPIVEQTLIKERFSSFTIKSRREVDFSNVGYVVPKFKDKNGVKTEESDSVKASKMMFDECGVSYHAIDLNHEKIMIDLQ